MSKDVSFFWDRGDSQVASTNDNIQDDRPERLGLGASYIPHNEAVKLDATLHKRLVKEQEKKKRRKRDEEDLETHQKIDDYEGDEDSRTATFRNKKLKLSDNNNTLEKKGTEGKKTRLKKKNKHARTTTTNEADKAKHSSKTPAFNKANNDNNIPKSTNDKSLKSKAYIPRSKRKTRFGRRTRSRQKNIKKDTRPLDQRPTYLTKGSSDYNPKEPRWKHRKGVKSAKINGVWVVQDKNSAVEGKKRQDIRQKSNSKKTIPASGKKIQSVPKVSGQKKDATMSKDDESFFNNPSNQNW